MLNHSFYNLNSYVVDFCRDSAKQASLMALTAPKVLPWLILP